MPPARGRVHRACARTAAVAKVLSLPWSRLHDLIVQDVSLAAALVDRLMDGGQVFYLKSPSWRTKDQPRPGADVSVG
jgi:hypothetical protein